MTTAHAISVLIIRLWALERIVMSGINLKSSWDFYVSLPDRTPEAYSSAILGLSYAGVILVIAVLFFFFADRFVGLLLPGPAGREEKFNVGIDDMVQAGAFLIGLFMLGRFGPAMIYAVIQGLTDPENVPIYGDLGGAYVGLPAYIFLLIFTLWLVIRPGHVARLFAWLRQANRPPEKQAAGETPGAE